MGNINSPVPKAAFNYRIDLSVLMPGAFSLKGEWEIYDVGM